ncbi:Somatostatin receptor type 5 [Holothuria leucospilota]|uniref:Somatostatin receptor type 5 n=1 Tax=Holothuria leucospilota TaxID=206669 RepID=A0A9Q1HHJ8_HOLLE|nr:Somatostatin receptor type 5 [Holothuria leucospilota]
MNFENGSNCSTVSQGKSMMTTTQSTLVVSAYFCLTLTILFGNTSVIWAYIKYPNVRNTPFNIYVLNLAFTDLCVGIFNVPFHALTILYSGLEYRNFYVSTVILYMGYVNALTSVFTITVMCYDHLQLISNPTTYQQNRTKRANRRIVVTLWSFSCVYCLYIVVMRAFLRKSDYSCGSNIPYLILMLIGNVIIPFFGVLSLKCAIVVKLQVHFLRMNKILRRSTKRKKKDEKI